MVLGWIISSLKIFKALPLASKCSAIVTQIVKLFASVLGTKTEWRCRKKLFTLLATYFKIVKICSFPHNHNAKQIQHVARLGLHLALLFGSASFKVELKILIVVCYSFLASIAEFLLSKLRSLNLIIFSYTNVYSEIIHVRVSWLSWHEI